jgi:hypothetical protein
MKLLCLLCLSVIVRGEWKAGVAKIDITPAGPIWMAGYAARSKPSEGVLAPIYVKALALEDERRGRVVILTSDLIGFPRSVAEEIAVGALKEYGLNRPQLLLNSSHTHSGPVVWPNLSGMYPMNAEQRATVEAFTRKLVRQCLEAIGAALNKLAPSRLDYSTGEAKFAVHRRLPAPDGTIKLAPNPAGPVDHAVPTLEVRDPTGALTAVLFSYSCHNTTMTGEFLQLHGDYAGFAQAEIEARHPGTVALFATGCAGDQNPNPRSALEHAQNHGRTLAAAVEKQLTQPKSKPLAGRLRTGFRQIELSFQPFGKNDFEEELKSANKYAVGRAQAMLNLIEERRIPRTLSYPVQVVKIGAMNIVALGGEVVVQYCLRLRRDLNDANLMVLGYANDVMCYIPDAREVAEGGYEAKDSFIYYGQPAPLAAKAEEELVTAVKNLWRRVK